MNDYEQLGETGDEFFWFRAKRDLLKRLIPQDAGSVLEVGAGSGELSEILPRGTTIVSIDINKTAAKYAKDHKTGIPIIGDATMMPIKDGAFDIAVASDVLEHIPEDKKAMQELNRTIREQGSLYVTVPAIPALFSEHDIALEHQRRYTKRMIRNIMPETLSATKLSYWNITTLLPVGAIRLIKKINGRAQKPKVDVMKLPAPLNNLLTSLMILENKLMKFVNIPLGLSLVLVAKKR